MKHLNILLFFCALCLTISGCIRLFLGGDYNNIVGLFDIILAGIAFFAGGL